MKASPSDQRSILDIARFDQQTNSLRHKAANLPELAELASTTVKSNNARDLRIAAETELNDVKRELLRAEGDVERQGDEPAVKRILQHNPCSRRPHPLKLAEPVIEQEHLYQQRRAAKGRTVKTHQSPHRRTAVGGAQRQAERQHQTGHARGSPQLQGNDQAFAQFGAVVLQQDEDVGKPGVHG
mgnify:CR=1 FL=1